MSKHTILLTLSFLLPCGIMSQDFYYSLEKQIPLIDSENKVVIKINETDPSMVAGAIENVWFIDEFKSIVTSRGIFQFNILQGLSLDEAEIELNSIFNVIRRIPAFYQIDYNGDRWDMIMADEFVVKFSPDAIEEQIIALNSEHNIEILSYNPWLGYLLRITENSQLNALEMANLYYENPLTVWSHPNFVAEVRFEQIEDDLFDKQWYLDNSNPS